MYIDGAKEKKMMEVLTDVTCGTTVAEFLWLNVLVDWNIVSVYCKSGLRCSTYPLNRLIIEIVTLVRSGESQYHVGGATELQT